MQITLENNRENHSVIKHYLGMSMNQMRYLEIDRIIEQKQVVSLIDFGCSEGLLLQKLGRSETMQLIVGVDIDESALSHALHNTSPESIQHTIQFSREFDQNLYIYQGDATKKYPELKQKNVQLITMIELIEHLQPELIPKAMQNIFGYLQPPYCFISTPNKEFNAFFDFDDNQMRHWDHKFEWTRAEFTEFCDKIQLKFGYSYTLGGIGQHITDSSKGHCTQYALFTRPVPPQPFNSETVEAQSELIEKSHYKNKSWKNNRDIIMRDQLFKSLYYHDDITFESAMEFFEKQQIGLCLKKNGQVLDKAFILSHLMKNENDFVWNENKYQRKRTYESEISEDLQSEWESDYHYDHSISSSFQNELSISQSFVNQRNIEPNAQNIAE